MKIPRPRLSVRLLMVIVAIVALLGWPATMAMRWDEYRRRAEHHEEVARALSSEIIALRKQGGQEAEAEMREVAMFRESRSAGRYRRGMQRPWRRVEAEPDGSR